MSYLDKKEFRDCMSKMHDISNSEDALKDVLFHSLYLLAQHHKMTHEDAMIYVESDCSEISWSSKESECA